MTLTPQETAAMAWADEVVIYEPGSDKKSGHIKPAILAALVRRLLEREKAKDETLKSCQSFFEMAVASITKGHPYRFEVREDDAAHQAIDDILQQIAAISALNPGEKK